MFGSYLGTLLASLLIDWAHEGWACSWRYFRHGNGLKVTDVLLRSSAEVCSTAPTGRYHLRACHIHCSCDITISLQVRDQLKGYLLKIVLIAAVEQRVTSC